jgi:hypothetical protein
MRDCVGGCMLKMGGGGERKGVEKMEVSKVTGDTCVS